MIDSDALTWNAPDGDHPARRASQRSAASVARGVKEDWLALFAPGAVVEGSRAAAVRTGAGS